uniref:Pyrroline-5-carboxylate reductase n=1 Tax=Neobodo designis TaxID=312471 RepID=A0A7S1MSP6_NEODS|mmetsp:Transcript_46105/g.141990  ORF Transcript_46105/g.141990 Transcript_46105/m.141990 type:complete len:370 (+) Transcript_46105:237-1346(+)
MLQSSLIRRPAGAAAAAMARSNGRAANGKSTPVQQMSAKDTSSMVDAAATGRRGTAKMNHNAAATARAATDAAIAAGKRVAQDAATNAALAPGSKTIAFLGFGVMAKAMAVGMQSAPNSPFGKYVLCDNNRKVLEGAASAITAAPATTTRDAEAAIVDADVIVLAVKPQGMTRLLKRLPLKENHLVVSIVAGWSIDRILSTLPERDPAKQPRVVRTMPNTPLQVGKGCTLYATSEACSEADELTVEAMFSSSGIIEPLTEAQLDAATGIAGSGPSYVALFMEALADGAVKQGLPRDLAIKLAAHTVEGAAAMCTEAGGGLHPAILKDRVCSPGGTSIHGVTELENHGVRKAIIAAVAGATKRSKELNKI